MSKKPLIGITTYRKDSGQGYVYMAVTEAYVQALIEAGALPVLVPLGLPDGDIERLRSRLDALLFTGGGDIAPTTYSGIPHAAVHDIDPDRDRLELQLARRVAEAGQPFLGICRGLQVVNVALGGTLYSHIEDQLPGAIKHDYWPDYPRDLIAHPVRVDEGTALSEILGRPMMQVNSLHHQGIRDLAPGLAPAAYAPDGLIEAVELPDHPFGLAVQWHPEALSGEHRMPALFEALVGAASNGHG